MVGQKPDWLGCLVGWVGLKCLFIFYYISQVTFYETYSFTYVFNI